MIETTTILVIVAVLYLIGVLWFTLFAFHSSMYSKSPRSFFISLLAGLVFPVFILWYFLQRG